MEMLLASRRNDNFIFSAFQSFSKITSHLRFVFDYKYAQALSSPGENTMRILKRCLLKFC